jgi:hypothetical protein
VDAFIRVRRVLRQTVDTTAPALLGPSLRRAREAALAGESIDLRRYEEIRQAYRRWREGGVRPPGVLGLALEERAEELRALDLGDYERLDS